MEKKINLKNKKPQSTDMSKDGSRRLIKKLNDRLASMEEIINKKDGEIANLSALLHAAYNSKRWKLISLLAEPYSRAKKEIKALLGTDKNVTKMPGLFNSGFFGLPVPFFSVLKFKQTEKPLVSIVIPVYNQWNYTYSCLRSILKNTKDVSYEVIVADDRSSDMTVNIEKFVKNIRVSRNKGNRGFLNNCNNGAKEAAGKYILFLNNDTNVTANWLKSMVKLAEADEKIGIVGSKLIYHDGRMQEAGGIVWKDASAWNYARFQDQIIPECNYVKEVDYSSGACLLVRKDFWSEAGGFDRRYAPAYYEDVDLAFEAKKRGYKTVYQPRSVVIHFEGVSCGKDESKGVKKYQAVNRVKFLKKWHNELESRHFSNGNCVFLARDRSRYKKTIVVVDHYVPEYDKDAGSRSVYHCIKYFIKKGMNVKFVGDNFIHTERYADELEQMGVEVLCGPWYARNFAKWVAENGKYVDYFFLSRPHIADKYVSLIKRETRAKILYYGVDLHYLRELRRYKTEKDTALLKSAKDWKKMEIDIMKKSDISFFPSDFEIKTIRSIAPGVKARVMPLYVYHDFRDEEYLPDSRQNMMFVGGFKHMPNLDGMKWFCKEVMPAVVKKLPHVTLDIYGSHIPDEIMKLRGPNVRIMGFLHDKDHARVYGGHRLVVSPLRYGAGMKGKNVEAMYNGVPLITTSIGAEGINCASVIIADEALSFAEKIIENYNSPDLADISRKLREYVRDNFSERVLDKSFSGVLPAAAGARPAARKKDIAGARR